MTLEEALDFFRAEGGWEPVCGSRQDSKSTCSIPLTGSPRFLGQCGRCLEYRTSTRVDLRGRSRIWLCDPCQSPNPPPGGTVGITVRTYQEAYRDLRAIARAEEKERKKAERERIKAEKRLASLPRLRKPRLPKRDPKDTIPEGPGS